MATVTLTHDEAALQQVVGAARVLRARRHLADGDVLGLQATPDGGPVLGRVRSGQEVHSALVTVLADGDGVVRTVRSSCTCGADEPCPHAVAVALLRRSEDTTASVGTPPEPAPWERRLAEAVADVPARPGTPAEVALQFDVTTAASRRRGPAGSATILLRPVVPGRATRWVRSGISWSTLIYHRVTRTADYEHLRLLQEIQRLAADTSLYSYDNVLALTTVDSRRIWDLLAEARDAGLPLVLADKEGTAVQLAAEPVRFDVRVGRGSSGLDLEPRLTGGATDLAHGSYLLIGEPQHGVAWWPVSDGDRGRVSALHLAPLTRALRPGDVGLLRGGTIHVPRRDEQRFREQVYPQLWGAVPFTVADDSVALPVPRPPELTLTVRRRAGHRAHCEWVWVQTVGASRRRLPLRPAPAAPPGADGADGAGASSVLASALDAVHDLAGLVEASPEGERLAASALLDGMATVRLLHEVLPRLEEVSGVTVDVVEDVPQGQLPEYREADDAPVLTFSGDASGRTDGAGRDWFDLAVDVTVAGERVPFTELFTALARGDDHLLLASGTYFSLDRREFGALARLIAESRALQDAPPSGMVRLNRYQAGAWSELDDIGEVTGGAAAWQASVRALVDAGDLSPQPAPPELQATMRPYQLAGFNWLVALHERGLGGVLADDMGLGKTLQTLAFFCHVRRRAVAAPFLVVAPTSVVFNWGAEARRFANGLRVVTVTETRARRGLDLAELAADADVVVTSYTLFRLEFAAYDALQWAGLVLDEAQMVKNHQSQGYRCARDLAAPFKLAVTGTPLENTLMELWSLLSITAPGLFPDPGRFSEYYRRPIERDRDAELLTQFRRRVAPLMLRRTKEQVAPDLPDKQEQVLELELAPRHGTVYRRYLQRERQKVLGLLDDVNKNRFEIFRSLTLLRQASLDVALVDPEHAGTPSTKLDALMEQLGDITAEGHRVLVFSQFTRFLGAARQRLKQAGIDHCYLDGSTRDRPVVLQRFADGDAPVFLISLKAGGFGLNLTQADYCILLDPWWNPATEAQAVDRVHRIGQTKKVMVYRYVAKDTIEEKVMALKATKAELFTGVMTGGEFESTTLGAADIRALLD